MGPLLVSCCIDDIALLLKGRRDDRALRFTLHDTKRDDILGELNIPYINIFFSRKEGVPDEICTANIFSLSPSCFPVQLSSEDVFFDLPSWLPHTSNERNSILSGRPGKQSADATPEITCIASLLHSPRTSEL
jgi:hypothetical protein